MGGKHQYKSYVILINVPEVDWSSLFSPSLTVPLPHSLLCSFSEPTSTVTNPWHHCRALRRAIKLHQTRTVRTMFFLATICLLGLASAQKVVKLSYCSIDEHHVRLDCKYSLPAESPEAFCKYTQGERLLDTTNPEEEQHAPFKNRAKARIFPGNICRLLFKNLPNGKSNFTCNIKQGDSPTASKTSVVEKKLLLPCSAQSVLLQSCSGLMLALMTFPVLLAFQRL
ncbi:uncharacterized protein LOC133550540 isoform X1 [Nerophis ophidion]|uniref:uncharacterized protein LOC133550540 isoform X1 n=1 Tax=Nerophis ophidion TaxID=159077 RepID=UPI002ADF6921|nr:uncharacterized protein LOC133550540 isoform X1 [Nerophis ophidion]